MRSIRAALPLVLALSFASPGAAQVRKAAPTTYGTSALSFVEIPGIAFFPSYSSDAYAGNPLTGSRYTSNCIGNCMQAAVSLPSGAKVVYLELDYYDATPDGFVGASLISCDYLGQNCISHPSAGAGPADCLNPGWLCSGTAAVDDYSLVTADLTADNVTVDNYSGSLRLRAITNGSAGQIAGVIVGFVLQVSAAPGSPSFNDVPTNHPFFQFIEALKASGITGGCQASPPLYCPDAPLTRGQMAVFLSKALGLQFR